MNGINGVEVLTMHVGHVSSNFHGDLEVVRYEDFRAVVQEMEEARTALAKALRDESDDPLLLLADAAAQRIIELEQQLANFNCEPELPPPAPVVAPWWVSRILQE